MDPWRELDEAAEIEFDYFRELMEEPPHGDNHGRKKAMGEAALPDTSRTGWQPMDSASAKRHVESTRHGTAYMYVKRRCRCPLCREWNRDRMRSSRHRPVTTP